MELPCGNPGSRIHQHTCTQSDGTVVSAVLRAHNSDGHQRATHEYIGRGLAAVMGFSYGGELEPGRHYERPLYLVPSDTLDTTQAAALGIQTVHDFLGGIVPHPFVATKSITHPLVGADAVAPRGWSAPFATAVRDVVLPGYSAFDAADARVAGLRLLAAGPVRVKRSRGIGGRGQVVASNRDELEAVLRVLPKEEIEVYGVVIERNLDTVTTYSVGRVEIADIVIAYVGTQRLTRNRAGEGVYGGSDLRVVRGGFDALLALDLDASMRQAVRQASRYDASALEHYPGLMASRRNYDVAAGRSRGDDHSGVLEQSWRVGGATPAEVAALAEFADRPRAHSVRAATVEVYGDCEPPAGAKVYFSGDLPELGRLTKFVVVDGNEDQA